MFLDRKGVLLDDFLPQGPTINAGVCRDTLQILQRSIQNKRHGILTWGVAMIHNNACPYIAAAMQNLI